MFKVLVILTVTVCCGGVSSSKLPNYVTPCKRSDPDLNECATREGRKVLPQILNGIPELRVPNLKPLQFPEAKLDVGGNLKIKLTDIFIYGFEDNNLEKFEMDFDKKKISVKIGFSKVNLQSQYEISGRILVLPISGKGPANITFINPVFDLTTDAEFIQKKGKEYVKIINPKVKYVSDREYYVLHNLFNGDSRLGDQMNKFLDENWREVSKEIGPAVLEIVSAIVTLIANGFFATIPLDELVPK